MYLCFLGIQYFPTSAVIQVNNSVNFMLLETVAKFQNQNAFPDRSHFKFTLNIAWLFLKLPILPPLYFHFWFKKKIKQLKSAEKLWRFYNKHLYTFQWDSLAVNILPLYIFESTHTYIHTHTHTVQPHLVFPFLLLSHLRVSCRYHNFSP